MHKAVPDRKLTVRLYNAAPKNPITNSIFEWNKIYPGVLDIAQPSLYVQDRPQVVSDHVRSAYDAMQAKQIIPGLSAGTFGEFDPKLMEQWSWNPLTAHAALPIFGLAILIRWVSIIIIGACRT